jgi:hypothetical protein
LKGSVWASLPAMSNASMKDQKPIIMVVASQDSASFFRDRSLGADSPISVSVRHTWLSSLYCLFAFQNNINFYTGIDCFAHCCWCSFSPSWSKQTQKTGTLPWEIA